MAHGLFLIALVFEDVDADGFDVDHSANKKTRGVLIHFSNLNWLMEVNRGI